MVDLNVTSMHIKNPSTGEWDEISIIAGKSAYQSAVDGGYQGTEAEFNAELADIKNAAEDAETAASHYPKIVNNYWYVWDATAGEFVNTGVSAEGKDGPAIVEVSATEPTDPTTEVWFKDQQSNPVEVYTVSEIDAMQGQALGNLAMIESNQATAAHAVGEYIVLNGQLYKVTATIAAGQTLTPGTNIAALSVGQFMHLNEIKTQRVTGKTNSAGNLGINLASSSIFISAAEPTGVGRVLQYFRSNGISYIKAIDWTTMQIVPNTEITVDVAYI